MVGTPRDVIGDYVKNFIEYRHILKSISINVFFQNNLFGKNYIRMDLIGDYSGDIEDDEFKSSMKNSIFNSVSWDREYIELRTEIPSHINIDISKIMDQFIEEYDCLYDVLQKLFGLHTTGTGKEKEFGEDAKLIRKEMKKLFPKLQFVSLKTTYGLSELLRKNFKKV